MTPPAQASWPVWPQASWFFFNSIQSGLLILDTRYLILDTLDTAGLSILESRLEAMAIMWASHTAPPYHRSHSLWLCLICLQLKKLEVRKIHFFSFSLRCASLGSECTIRRVISVCKILRLQLAHFYVWHSFIWHYHILIIAFNWGPNGKQMEKIDNYSTFKKKKNR